MNLDASAVDPELLACLRNSSPDQLIENNRGLALPSELPGAHFGPIMPDASPKTLHLQKPRPFDRLSQAARSAHMRRIRKVDTRPEIVVRRIAHALGLRFRLHRRDLPGTPDIVFPRHRKVVQVHGCFWHQHEGCRLARQPKSRLDYWLPKLARNAARDRAAAERLAALGWKALTIWECETREPDLVRRRLATFMLDTRAPDDQAAEAKRSR
jgi:DNA mismatch endonuclease, patch repair protein